MSNFPLRFTPHNCIVLCFALFLSYLAAAQSSQCSQAMDDRVETHLEKIKSWTAFHHSYRTLRRCDNGGTSEVISEFVVHTLAYEWANVDVLATLSLNDAAFKSYVLGHIDATTSEDDLLSIQLQAQGACPKDSAAFCKEIALKAKAAREEALMNDSQ